MVKKIFAIAGADGTGKSSLALSLRCKLNLKGKDTVITSFASGVYDVVAKKWGVTKEYILKNKEDYRRELRKVGEERRKEDPQYWIKFLQNRLIEYDLGEGHDIVIIDDLRFAKEADFVKESGGEILYLDRSISPEEMKDSTFQELPYVCCQADRHLISKSKPVKDLVEELKKTDYKRFSENLKILYKTYLSNAKHRNPELLIFPLHQIAENLKDKVNKEELESTMIQVLKSMSLNHSRIFS